jgi:predicted Zn-dependent protease
MLLVSYKKDPASLERALKLASSFANSENAALIDTYGWVRLRRGEVTEALPALKRAASKAPGSKLIQYHLGMAQYKAGQKDEARTSLESAVTGAPQYLGMDEARATLTALRQRG